MPTSVMVYDETAAGTRAHAMSLEFPTVRISVRDLIRVRVRNEVRAHSRPFPGYGRGSVDPGAAERVLNGYKPRPGGQIDEEEQFRHALTAFERNGFFILVDDQQVTSLDGEIVLAHDTTIRFIRLLPLVGG